MEGRCDLQNARVAGKLRDERVRTRGVDGFPLPPGDSFGLTCGATRVPQINIVIRVRDDWRALGRAACNDLLECKCPLRPARCGRIDADVVLNVAELGTERFQGGGVLRLENQDLRA